eukprot:PhF_6_TR4491/c0_g1_i5/m.6193
MFYCCKVCEEGFKHTEAACSACLCPEDRPSPMFVYFSTIMNVIPAIITIVALAKESPSTACSSTNSGTWIYVSFLLYGGNLVFAVYLYYRFMAERNAGKSTAASASKLFMYDPGVYLYFWFLVFHVVWVIIGFNWAGDEHSCSEIKSAIHAGGTCIIVYLIAGGFVIALSLLTECCRSPKWEVRQQTLTTPFAQQPPMNTAAAAAPVYYVQPQQQQQPQYVQPQAGGAPPPAYNPYAAPQ